MRSEAELRAWAIKACRLMEREVQDYSNPASHWYASLLAEMGWPNLGVYSDRIGKTAK